VPKVAANAPTGGGLCREPAGASPLAGEAATSSVRRVLDVEGLRSSRLRSVPFQWARLESAVTAGHAAALSASFPTEGFWLIEDHDGEKSYAYAARPLITLGAREPVTAPDLDPVWHRLGEDLLGEEYRSALSALIGQSLDEAVMEASIWRWGAGHYLGPHRDMPEKIVTQVIYLSDGWRREWGGTLCILRSPDERDVHTEVMPDTGSSTILVRSDDSWHAVTRITEGAPAPRRNLIVTWYRPGTGSPVWTVDGGRVRCRVGVPEVRRPAPATSSSCPQRAAVADSNGATAPARTPCRQVARPRTGRRIGMVGTFDLENLGDLLFPMIAEHELRRRLGDVDLRLYSYRRMTAGAWPLDVESLGRLPTDVADLDGLLVGGGEIVHAAPVIAPGYRPDDPDVHHPLGLWLTPTLLAAAAGIPIAWNAPGAIEGLPARLTPLVEAALESIDYASVRDARSARLLARHAPRVRPHVVPDTVFGIAALLPRQPSAAFTALVDELGVGPSGYVVVQATGALEHVRGPVVELLERAAAEGRSVIELPIGPVHGDAAGALALPLPTAGPATWPGPLLLAELLARSDGVVAQSLHAGIIAAAHGVPVFRPPAGRETKHEILLGCGGVSILAEGVAPGRLGRTRPAGIEERQAELDTHWDRVADALSSTARRTARAPVLSLVAAMPHLAGIRPQASAEDSPLPPSPSRTPLAAPEGHDLAVSRGARVHPAPVVSIIIPTLDRIDLLQACLDSIDLHVTGRVGHETIVVANGTSLGALHPVQHRDDVVLLRSRVNRGFAGGCNWGAEHARGEYLVFLNDDTEVTPHWIEYLLATASRQRVGAVGSRVLQGDGSVQETGSVLWHDGSAHGVGRGLPPGSRAFGAVRDVDFVSGCALAVRRAAWESVGGMDEAYFPAYYEDVDLCMRLRDAGFRVVVDPRAVVRHAESASSDPDYRRFLHLRNRATFMSRWGQRLRDHDTAGDPDLDLAVRRSLHRSSGRRPRLLVVDDRLPDPGFGSGFGRMLVAVAELAAEYEITFLPSTGGDSSVVLRLADLGVDVTWEPVEEHLRRWPGWYEAVLVSRPHNFPPCRDALRRHQPSAALLYDVEALWHRRLQREAGLTTDEQRRGDILEQAAQMEAMERSAVAGADHVICLSTDEAAISRSWSPRAEVTLIPPLDPATQDTGHGFWARRDVLLPAGWLAGSASPNVDALRFFVAEVLPHLTRLVPDVRLVVTGGLPPPEVVALEGPHVAVVGHLADLSAAFARARVVVVPTRFGSGVKLKTVEALQHGVPVVATSVGAEGIEDGGTGCVAVHDDPREFAAAAGELLRDPDRWQRARDAALRFACRRPPETGLWSQAVGRALASRRQGAGVKR
jgi:GT2 family glycosyltransferase